MVDQCAGRDPLELDPRIVAYKRIATLSMVACTVITLGLWWAVDLPVHRHELFQEYVGMIVMTSAMAGITTWMRARFLHQVTLPMLATALRWLPEVFQLMVFLYWVPGLISIADYLVMPSSLPLADAWLAAPETALGLTHAATYPWFAENGLVEPMTRIYFLLDPQIKLLAAYLLVVRRDLFRLWQYTSSVTVAGVLSVPMLWAFPATGPTLWFEGQYRIVPPTPEWVAPLLELRSGEMTDFTHVAGLLSCPSFHTVFALYLARGWADAPWAIFGAAIVINGLVVVSTVPVGAHYLVDVVGGIVWAVVFAVIVDRLAVRMARSQVTARARRPG